MMRGGTASVFHSRFFKANNKECPDFNPDQSSIYVFMINANNLYGGVMLTGVYFRVEVLTLKIGLPETLSLRDMDDFTLLKKYSKS